MAGHMIHTEIPEGKAVVTIPDVPQDASPKDGSKSDFTYDSIFEDTNVSDVPSGDVRESSKSDFTYDSIYNTSYTDEESIVQQSSSIIDDSNWITIQEERDTSDSEQKQSVSEEEKIKSDTEQSILSESGLSVITETSEKSILGQSDDGFAADVSDTSAWSDSRDWTLHSTSDISIYTDKPLTITDISSRADDTLMSSVAYDSVWQHTQDYTPEQKGEIGNKSERRTSSIGTDGSVLLDSFEYSSDSLLGYSADVDDTGIDDTFDAPQTNTLEGRVSSDSLKPEMLSTDGDSSDYPTETSVIVVDGAGLFKPKTEPEDKDISDDDKDSDSMNVEIMSSDSEHSTVVIIDNEESGSEFKESEESDEVSEHDYIHDTDSLTETSSENSYTVAEPDYLIDSVEKNHQFRYSPIQETNDRRASESNISWVDEIEEHVSEESVKDLEQQDGDYVTTIDSSPHMVREHLEITDHGWKKTTETICVETVTTTKEKGSEDKDVELRVTRSSVTEELNPGDGKTISPPSQFSDKKVPRTSTLSKDGGEFSSILPQENVCSDHDLGDTYHPNVISELGSDIRKVTFSPPKSPEKPNDSIFSEQESMTAYDDMEISNIGLDVNTANQILLTSPEKFVQDYSREHFIFTPERGTLPSFPEDMSTVKSDEDSSGELQTEVVNQKDIDKKDDNQVIISSMPEEQFMGQVPLAHFDPSLSLEATPSTVLEEKEQLFNIRPLQKESETEWLTIEDIEAIEEEEAKQEQYINKPDMATLESGWVTIADIEAAEEIDNLNNTEEVEHTETLEDTEDSEWVTVEDLEEINKLQAKHHVAEIKQSMIMKTPDANNNRELMFGFGRHSRIPSTERTERYMLHVPGYEKPDDSLHDGSRSRVPSTDHQEQYVLCLPPKLRVSERDLSTLVRVISRGSSRSDNMKKFASPPKDKAKVVHIETGDYSKYHIEPPIHTHASLDANRDSTSTSLSQNTVIKNDEVFDTFDPSAIINEGLKTGRGHEISEGRTLEETHSPSHVSTPGTLEVLRNMTTYDESALTKPDFMQRKLFSSDSDDSDIINPAELSEIPTDPAYATIATEVESASTVKEMESLDRLLGIKDLEEPLSSTPLMDVPAPKAAAETDLSLSPSSLSHSHLKDTSEKAKDAQSPGSKLYWVMINK